MHYPPETASVMLIAQMIATVLQVSHRLDDKSLVQGEEEGKFNVKSGLEECRTGVLLRL